MYPLQNRVIVITGASGGMGRVLCRRLAQEGALLALTSNDAPAMEALLKDLPQNTLARVFDIADERQVAAFFAEIRETFGGADALLNLAGLSIPAQIAEMAVEDYGLTMDVNLCRRRAGKCADHQHWFHGGAARQWQCAPILHGQGSGEYVLQRAANSVRAQGHPGDYAQSWRRGYAFLGQPSGQSREAVAPGGHLRSDAFCAHMRSAHCLP